MKENRILSLLAAACVAVFSCEQVEISAPENIDLGGADSLEAITLAIECPEELVLSSYDRISVFSMAQPDSQAVFDFVRMEGGKAIFEGFAKRSGTYCAVYPQRDDNALGFVDGDGQQCSLTSFLPAIQQDMYSSNVYVTMADSSSLKFYPTCASLKVPLFKDSEEPTNGVRVSVIGMGGESLCGAMNIVMHKGAAPVSVSATGSNTERGISQAVSIQQDTAWVEMNVVPRVLTSGYKISVLLEDYSTTAVTEIREPVTIASSRENVLSPFVYAPTYYVDFACSVIPDFGNYKLEFDESTMTGRVWFFTSDMPKGLFQNRVNVTSVTIPSGITSIGESSMQGMSGLTEIKFESPCTVKSFGLNSIAQATSLVSLNVPASVEVLGQSCLQGATALKNLTFESGTKCRLFGQNALYNVNTMETLMIPKSVTKIGPYALQNMSSLSNLTFEEGSKLDTLDNKCLENTALLGTIVLPASLKYINNPSPNTTYTPKLTIISQSEVPPVMDGKFGKGTGQIQTIKVPAASIEAYKASKDQTGADGTGWNRYVSKPGFAAIE